MYPYALKKIHALKVEDHPNRVAYAEWMLSMDSQHIQNIIWSDESLFTRNAMWNRRVCHHWAIKGRNPNVTRQLSRPNIMSIMFGREYTATTLSVPFS